MVRTKGNSGGYYFPCICLFRFAQLQVASWQIEAKGKIIIKRIEK